MKCPKCGFEQEDGLLECLRCGVVFAKYEALQKKKEIINSQYSPKNDKQSIPSNNASTEIKPTAKNSSKLSAPIKSKDIEQIKEQFEKLQLGMQSIFQYQENFGLELENQQKSVNALINHIAEIQDDFGTKTNALQEELKKLSATINNTFTASKEELKIDNIKDDLMTLNEKLSSLPDGETLSSLKSKLDEIEDLKKQMMSSSTGATEVSPQEVALLKTEINALRAEVQSLLNQEEISLSKASPVADKEKFDVLYEKVEDLTGRLGEVKQDTDSTIAHLWQELKTTKEKSSTLTTQIEDLTQSLTKADLLNNELTRLKDSIQKFQEDISESMKTKINELENRLKSIDSDLDKIREIEETFEKLKNIFTRIESE